MEKQMMKSNVSEKNLQDRSIFTDKSEEDLVFMLDAHIDKHRAISEFVRSNSKLGFDWKLPKFFKVMHNTVPSQVYGVRIQNRVADILGLDSFGIKSDGDFRSLSGRMTEFKCSFRNRGNKHYRFLQVRPWEELDYIFLAIDNENNYNYTIFFLTKDQLLDEIKLNNKICHGKTDLKTIDLTTNGRDNNMWDRWVVNYKVDLFDTLKTMIK